MVGGHGSFLLFSSVRWCYTERRRRESRETLFEQHCDSHVIAFICEDEAASDVLCIRTAENGRALLRGHVVCARIIHVICLPQSAFASG